MAETKEGTSLLKKVKENYFLAMIVCCAVPLTAIAGLSLLGFWGLGGIMP
jgi:hypothetical protein